MKPLCLVGTEREIGKTTLSIGILHALRKRGSRVAYCKPLGQRVREVKGRELHDDALAVCSALGADGARQMDVVVPLPKGRVEREVFDPRTDEKLAQVRQGVAALAAENDLVVVESMGHVAMGSCLGVSAAEVIRAVGGRAILVSGGGIGRAIDNISLCSTFLSSRGADLMGVVVNKVWRDKYDKVNLSVRQGLENLGLPCYGIVPYDEQLSNPTMKQVYDLIHGELVSGADNLETPVAHTIVAAMESSHMVRYLREGTLVITPGDRSDNILAALTAHMLSDRQGASVAGMVLTGGFRPDGTLMRMVNDSKMPVILVKEDTYTVASKFRQTVFKIRPDDPRQVDAAIAVVGEYVDIDAIVEGLGG